MDLDHIIANAVASTTFTTPSHPKNPNGWQLNWGTQLDIRPVMLTGTLTDTAVAGYLAKYASKSTEATGHISERITPDTIDTYATVTTHVGRIIRACWTLGYRPDCDHPNNWKTTYGRLRRWAHLFGFGGHHTTKSRHYSTTRTALKEARYRWYRARNRTDEETTLVVGSLTFIGMGYRNTGDQWLALTAAAQAREQRQIAKEQRKVA